jgi:hypothetical protein
VLHQPGALVTKAEVALEFQEAAKSWRRIRGVERIAELLAGTVFTDGVPAPVDEPEQQQLAA